MLEFCAAKDLHILNEASEPTTFYMPGMESSPDLTLSSQDLVPTILDWTVHVDYSASDHGFITYSTTATPTYKAPSRFRSKHMDRSEFCEAIKSAVHISRTSSHRHQQQPN